MKKNLILLSLSFVLFSCEEEGALTKTGANDLTISPVAQLLYTGTFSPTSGIAVAGQAKILLENNQYKLQLSNFSISSGPDLKVYLSKSSAPNEFITLGNLTSATVYAIPQNVNFAEYTHVLIHCQEFNHLFAIAPLMQN